MFCCQNMTLGHKMLWLTRCSTDKHIDSSETSVLPASSSALALCHHPAMPLLLIMTLCILTCQSGGNNLKRRVGIGICGTLRIDVGSTNMLSDYSKVPQRRSVKLD